MARPSLCICQTLPRITTTRRAPSSLVLPALTKLLNIPRSFVAAQTRSISRNSAIAKGLRDSAAYEKSGARRSGPRARAVKRDIGRGRPSREEAGAGVERGGSRASGLRARSDRGADRRRQGWDDAPAASSSRGRRGVLGKQGRHESGGVQERTRKRMTLADLDPGVTRERAREKASRASLRSGPALKEAKSGKTGRGHERPGGVSRVDWREEPRPVSAGRTRSRTAHSTTKESFEQRDRPNRLSPVASSHSCSKTDRRQEQVSARRPKAEEKEEEEEEEEEDYFLHVPRTTADSEFIVGRRSVLAALKAGRRTFYKVILNLPNRAVTDPDESLAEILTFARERNLPVENDKEAAHAIARRQNISNTIVASFILEASPISQPEVESLGSAVLEQASYTIHHATPSTPLTPPPPEPTQLIQYEQPWLTSPRFPFLLWLHGVTDTGNIGSIIRTAVYMGVDTILLSSRATGAISAHAHVTATGATEFARLLRVAQPVAFIQASQRAGWKFWASASADASVDAEPRFGRKFARSRMSKEAPFPTLSSPTPLAKEPTVVILGNETEGLPDWLTAAANGTVSIGGPSALAARAGVDSYNVSVAAALLCERFLREPVAGQAGEAAQRQTRSRIAAHA